ncbi:HIT family protein [Actimicrobium antarcticum]|uniref:HIT family protein n=1 Tax=Actimicrobium antarcticum TaxID=1051899 RepID=A0ABP7T9D4_9BURK
MADKLPGCELCNNDGGEVIVSNDQFRVLLVDDAGYPGFCRVVWTAHVAEMTDLLPAERSTLMAAVCKVEMALREVMAPHKINLAALGNMVPHLHWHVIPRFTDDAHFPAPVWAAPARVPSPHTLAERCALLPVLRAALLLHFGH